MNKCEHCGATFWFSLSDTGRPLTTRDGSIALTILWRCPKCRNCNAIPSTVSYGPTEGDEEELLGITIPIPEHGAAPAILAQFTEEQLRAALEAARER